LTSPVVFLCGEDELDKERRGYARAFSRIAPVAFVAPSANWQTRLHETPLLLLNPDGRPWLPDGIERAEAPTAVFHIDTYVATARRMRWSAMYDYAFVFHPSFEETFLNAGIPGARLLPHAAERDLFDRPETPRRFEVGWVGRSGRSIYSVRDRLLQALTSRFATNQVDRLYSPEEMADVYRSSKIVVNVSRDDWPQDANMRCFEAMAAGALLITRVPTELTTLGFEEGVHFAGWRDPGEVPQIVARWLADDGRRQEVAWRSRALVLRAHTYDARAAAILATVRNGVSAPARTWPEERVQALRFDYFVESGDVARSLSTYRRLTGVSVWRAFRRLPGLLRLGAKIAKRALGWVGRH
jgi:hypothetical protein